MCKLKNNHILCVNAAKYIAQNVKIQTLIEHLAWKQENILRKMCKLKHYLHSLRKISTTFTQYVKILTIITEFA